MTNKVRLIVYLMTIVIIGTLVGCGDGNAIENSEHGKKPEFTARNNTAAITYTMNYSTEQMKKELCDTFWNCQYFENLPARNYCFFEDGSLLINYLGVHPDSLYPAGNRSELYERYGEWEYDEREHLITLSYDGNNDTYVMYEYDGKVCMISADWNPANEGKYSFLAEEDEDYEYDNTPSESSMLFKASEEEKLLFEAPEGAGIKNDLVGIWATDPANIELSHIILLKSDGTLFFSINIGGSNVTHKGLWAEKDGKLYLTYFDEYSGDGFENLTQAKCWFVFDYTLENGVLRSEDVFFDNDYIFYADESQAAL